MKIRSLALTILAALLAAPAADAQAPQPGAGTHVWFTGSSNLRRFTCRATQVGGGESLPDASAATAAAPDSAGVRVSLRIPVAGLDCGIWLMNRHLRHALHAERHPAIQFTLAEYELVPGDSGWVVRMHGELSIAGVQRRIAVDGAVAEDGAGTTHVRGRHEVRVTGYGVHPPRRFAGLLHVHEQVTVHFDVALPRAAPAPAVAQTLQRRE
jgi:polyisoprenoid-binding protein YceI